MSTLEKRKTFWFLEPRDEDANTAILEDKKAKGKHDEGYYPNIICSDGKPHRLWDTDFPFIANMVDSKKVRKHKFNIYNQEPDEPKPKRWVPIPLIGVFKYILPLHRMREPNVDTNVREIFRISNKYNDPGEKSTKRRIILEPSYVFMMGYLRSGNRQLRLHGISAMIQKLIKGHYEEVWLYGPEISEGMEQIIDMAILFGIPVIPKTKETTVDFALRWQ